MSDDEKIDSESQAVDEFLFDEFAENAQMKNMERRKRIVRQMDKSREVSRAYFYEKVLPANGM